jgi:hypothetical protein
LQIEANRPRLRDTPENRLRFAHGLFAAMQTYFSTHLGFGMDGKKTRNRTPPSSGFRQPHPHSPRNKKHPLNPIGVAAPTTVTLALIEL